MKIKDAAQQSGLSVKTVRYYEECRLLQVSREANTYRDYTEENVKELRRIRLWRELGVSVKDIRLWKDGVLSTQEMLGKRKEELEKENRLGERQKMLCDAILSDVPAKEAGFFSEKEASGADIREPFFLGLDIGTTTVSVKLVSLSAPQSPISYTVEHRAVLALPGYPDAYAEDGEALLSRATALLTSLCGTYKDIRAIGLTGQMHGILCLDETGRVISPLYTWQNGFGARKTGAETIGEKATRLSGQSVPTGYGLLTLFALRELGLFPAKTAKIATVADALAARLCGLPFAPMHPSNAASLGFFNTEKNAFAEKEISLLGIPLSLLPPVADGFLTVGEYRGIPVSLAIGDNQASILASLRAEEDQVLLNVGTGSQVSIVAKQVLPADGGVEVRPYFDGKFVCSGAALCGGRAYAILADFVSGVLSAFGHTDGKKEIYDTLSTLASEEEKHPLAVDTRFSGTRQSPDICGMIGGIRPDNFDVAHLSRGVLRGIIRELHDFYRAMDQKKTIAVLSGNAMRKTAALRELAGELFGIPCLTLAHSEEAALGAALYGAVASGLLRREEVAEFIVYRE